MKNNTILLIVLLSCTCVLSQTKDDYAKTLTLVSNAFNEKSITQIYQKFSSDLKGQIQEDEFKTSLENLHKEKGNVTSYELIMDEENEKSYLVEFDNSTMLLLINLTKSVQISVFEIKEY